MLERGLFDGLFLADVLGAYDVYGGNADASLRGGVQIPLLDPMALVPAMAHATTHLGFGVTCNLAYETPFLFARRMATLDHLTRGRIGWNIVTGYLDSAARAMGFDAQIEHDDRYDLADEYLQVVYALWEGGWADDAVMRDRRQGIYTDPATGAPGAPPRQAVPCRRRAAVGAVAAAHTGAVPGGRLRPRPRLRCPAR